MDDLSAPEKELISEALAHRALEAHPPPAYDVRIRRRAGWRGMAFAGSLVLVVAAVAITLAVVLPFEGRKTPTAPVSPDESAVQVAGELVFTQGGHSIKTVSLPDGTVTEAAGGDVATTDLEVSPDGTLVAYAVGLGTYEGELRVLDLETGDSESIVTREGTIMSPSWTADGTRVSFIAESYEQDPSIPIFRIGSVKPDGTGQHFVDEPATGAVDLDVSSDGSRLVYVDGAHSDVLMLDLGTGQSSTLWSRKEGGVANTVALSPDGGQLAVVAGGGLYLVPIDQPEAVQAVETGLGIFDVAWMSEGQSLILSAETHLEGDADLYMFDLTSGSPTLLPSTSDDDLEPSIATPASERGQ
jgi:Tol biopolymer transport system component